MRGLWCMLQNCHLHAGSRLWRRSSSRSPSHIRTSGSGSPPHPPTGFPGHPPALPQGRHRAPQRPQAQPAGVVSKISEDELAECPHTGFRPLARARVLPRRGAGASQVRQTRLERRLRLQRDGLRISQQLVKTYLTKAFDNGDDQLPGHTPVPHRRGHVRWTRLRFVRPSHPHHLSRQYLGTSSSTPPTLPFFPERGDYFVVPAQGSRDAYAR